MRIEHPADLHYPDLEEALVRFRRGDMLMCMFYLDRAGFVGIEKLWGAR